MHGAGAGDGYTERREGVIALLIMQMKAFSPYAVQNIPVRDNSNVQGGGQNVVESTNFLISEKNVKHPSVRSGNGFILNIVRSVLKCTSILIM